MAIRASLPNSLRAFNSPAFHRPSIWATFGEAEPAALDARLRYRQIISRALGDTTHNLGPFGFGDDNDGHLGDPDRNDTLTGIPGRNSSIPSIFSSSSAILGGRSILVDDSQSTVAQVYNLPGFHEEWRSMNLVIPKERHMGADEDFSEIVPIQMASASSPVPMPIPNQEKAPDMGAGSELPGEFGGDNRHVRRYDDLQAVYLDKQAIGDGLNVDIRDEIIGHEVSIVPEDKSDADDHGSLDIGRTNRLHGEWYLAMLPILDAGKSSADDRFLGSEVRNLDAVRLSSVSEIQTQEGDDVDFERGSQTPLPRDYIGRFGADAAEGEKENPIGSIEANDLCVANELTSISPNIFHNFVDLDEAAVFNDLVLVFIEQPYPSDLVSLPG
jgi:hypothetical protein